MCIRDSSFSDLITNFSPGFWLSVFFSFQAEIKRVGGTLTRDDVEISVPNSVMGNAKVINETGGPHEKFRIRVGVGVAYGSDIDQVEQALINVASSHPEICSTPKPLTRFRAFGNSSLDFELLAWVNEPILRGRLEHELHCGVYKAFNEAGIVIPFPQQDIHIKNQD